MKWEVEPAEGYYVMRLLTPEEGNKIFAQRESAIYVPESSNVMPRVLGEVWRPVKPLDAECVAPFKYSDGVVLKPNPTKLYELVDDRAEGNFIMVHEDVIMGKVTWIKDEDDGKE